MLMHETGMLAEMGLTFLPSEKPTMAPNGKVVESQDGTDTPSKSVKPAKSKSDTHLKLPKDIGTDYTFKRKVVWFNAIGFLILHLCAVYGYFLCITGHGRWPTFIWMLFVALASGEGVTIGAHRLYSHKAFKAKFPLKLGLILLQTIAGQNCLYIWVRDHRQHHKYSDTDADPHNANRGFFFSHVGWLMSKKHPAVISKGKTIDMSDLEADWLVMFQKTFYKSLYIIFALALPIGIPVWLWDETYINSIFISYFGRYMLMLNITWLVNSAAHFYGYKPYDETMRPVESWVVSYLSFGEGWHNYHHAFPWDYRAAEFGTRYSFTTFLINVFAQIGWAYDLRTTSPQMVAHRVKRTGDGTHFDHEVIMAQTHIGKLDEIEEVEPIENSEDEMEVDGVYGVDTCESKEYEEKPINACGIIEVQRADDNNNKDCITKGHPKKVNGKVDPAISDPSKLNLKVELMKDEVEKIQSEDKKYRDRLYLSKNDVIKRPISIQG